jgi:hypothetical protein
LPDDKDVKKRVKVYLGKTFNIDRANNNLYGKWVDEITGDPEDD